MPEKVDGFGERPQARHPRPIQPLGSVKRPSPRASPVDQPLASLTRRNFCARTALVGELHVEHRFLQITDPCFLGLGRDTSSLHSLASLLCTILLLIGLDQHGRLGRSALYLNCPDAHEFCFLTDSLKQPRLTSHLHLVDRIRPTGDSPTKVHYHYQGVSYSQRPPLHASEGHLHPLVIFPLCRAPPRGACTSVKMALNSDLFADRDGSLNSREKDEKDLQFSQDYDEENPPRRHSRLAPVHAGLEGDDRASVGKQLELEAENAIKYRTCSWQKVRRRQIVRGTRWRTNRVLIRLPRCSSPSTSVWPSCPSRGRTLSWVWSPD